MKRLFPFLLCPVLFLVSCATVQSIIKSTFPYTSNVIIPASEQVDEGVSVKSSATSIDQVFGNQKGTSYIKNVRIASAKLTAYNPSNTSLGMFKSIKLYISSGESGEIMVASRSDIQPNIGSDLALDIDNSRFLDDYVQGSSISIRLVYTLRDKSTTDVSIRTALSFTSVPKT